MKDNVTVSEGRSDSNILAAGGCDVVFRAKYLKPVPYISVRRYEGVLQPPGLRWRNNFKSVRGEIT